MQKKLSDQEKRKIIGEILGANHSATGKHFLIFSEMMDGLGSFNHLLSFAELIPVLNTWLSGSGNSTVICRVSFASILLFPFRPLINLINLNENGLRAYSYRAISYSITAWAFDKPGLTSSPKIISNLTPGSYTNMDSLNKYHKIWADTSASVIMQLEKICFQKKINSNHLAAVFKALGQGSPETLSQLILKGFESEFNSVTKNIWRSNYSIAYPE